MANPDVITITAGSWQKVATNITSVHVRPLSDTSTYTWTYRDTGDPAPTLATEQATLPRDTGLSICTEAGSGIDIYVWCKSVDGVVRVDEGLTATYLIDG